MQLSLKYYPVFVHSNLNDTRSKKRSHVGVPVAIDDHFLCNLKF